MVLDPNGQRAGVPPPIDPPAGVVRCGPSMKHLRLALAFLAAAGTQPALAFHEGGVGSCEGCHSMHGKQDGSDPGPFLLKGSDSSSACLNCHSSDMLGTYEVFTGRNVPQVPPAQLTPGGDFGWLLKSYAWLGQNGTTESSPGEQHGHSILALDYGLAPDSVRLTAPGGSYPSDRLACTSCHDPHGRYRLSADGNIRTTGAPIVSSGSYGGAALALPGPSRAVGAYRLLAGVGYSPRSAGPGVFVPFGSSPPIALSPREFNRSERFTDTRVAYGSGMSEWCANCHGGIHVQQVSNSSSPFRHASGATARLSGGGELAIYNNYVRTGVLTGTQATSYTSMVPYEESMQDRVQLSQRAVSDGSVTGGPASGFENVSCLSCHRAHASGWDHALRWNMPPSGIIVFGGSWPGLDASGEAALARNAQGRTRGETRAAMYDREPSVYSAYQKVLCNKCHAKD
jgi:predicted CXXCH cytochrome family protein